MKLPRYIQLSGERKAEGLDDGLILARRRRYSGEMCNKDMSLMELVR